MERIALTLKHGTRTYGRNVASLRPARHAQLAERQQTGTSYGPIPHEKTETMAYRTCTITDHVLYNFETFPIYNGKADYDALNAGLPLSLAMTYLRRQKWRPLRN